MKAQQRLQRMESQKMLPLIISFSLPSIISMTAMAFYNVADTIFVGRLGTNAIAGLTLIMPLQMFMLAFGLLLGIGAASYISRNLGAKKYDKANHVFSSAVFLGFLIGITLLVVAVSYLEPLLRFIGRNSEATPQAMDYGLIIMFGIPIFLFNMMLSQIARAEGNPNIAMNSQLAGTILNIVLDPIFIFVLKLGIKGAALATIISGFIALMIIAGYFIGPHSHLKFSLKNIMPAKDEIIEIGKAGVPSFTRHIAASFVAMLTNGLLAGYGPFALAIMGINNRFVMMFFMPIIGTGQGFMPIAGYNYGAKNFDRVRDAFWKATMLVTVFCGMGWILVELFPEMCIKIFSQDPVVIEQGRSSLRLINAMLPLVGFQIIGSTLYQAIGNGLAGFVLSISRQVLAFLPIVIFFNYLFGLSGIFMAVPAADIISALITAIWLKYTLGQLNEMQNLSPAISG